LALTSMLGFWIMYTQVYYCGLGPMVHLTRLIRDTGFPLQAHDKAFGAGSMTGLYPLWSPVCYVGYVPAYYFLKIGMMLGSVVLLKWLLLGTIRTGITPLWSNWAARWDFMFVYWGAIGKFPSHFEGTLIMGAWLRLFGMKVGKNVVFTSGGASQLSEPDLVEVGDHCIIDQGPWQSHTFEDGVMKRAVISIGNNCKIGENAMILYGTKMNDHSVLYANSTIMKDELLNSYSAYAGCPLSDLPFDVCAGETMYRAPTDHHMGKEEV